jgi:hypothetical protein
VLYQFVILPTLAVAVLGCGVYMLRQSRRVRAYRGAVLAGGVAAVLFGAWVLGSAGVNAWRVASLTREQVEGDVRRGMTEANGEEPRKLALAPAGFGRLAGTALVRGEPVVVTVELRVEAGGVVTAWEQRPAAPE